MGMMTQRTPGTRALEECDVVTLCGSTRFKSEMLEAAERLTMEGWIVLMPNVFGHVDDIDLSEPEKERLDEMHKRKIDMSDKVLVINVGGYIGESTQSEIEYAESWGKPIEYLEGGLND